jgi:hypothetical protein
VGGRADRPGQRRPRARAASRVSSRRRRPTDLANETSASKKKDR